MHYLIKPIDITVVRLIGHLLKAIGREQFQQCNNASVGLFARIFRHINAKLNYITGRYFGGCRWIDASAIDECAITAFRVLFDGGSIKMGETN